jgi:hypothetical protein
VSKPGAKTSKTASGAPFQTETRLVPVAVTSSIPRFGAMNSAQSPKGFAFTDGRTGLGLEVVPEEPVVKGVKTSAVNRAITVPGRMSNERFQFGSKNPPYGVAWCCA